MNKTMREAIVVLGMHRSGTSALTGALSMLGARLPARQMPLQPDNPTGFFESEKIQVIHDGLLAAAGTSWFGLDRVPDEWFRSEQAASYCNELMLAMREDYGDATTIVVKDPRMCRLMPLWRDVFGHLGIEPRFAIIIRNPMEVAQSLKKRNDLSIDHGCLLWLGHAIEAERETRNSARVFVSYDQLLRDPGQTAEYVAGQLGIDELILSKKSAGEIAAFVNPAKRHHVAELERHNPCYDLLSEAHRAFLELIRSPNDKLAQGRLDDVHTLFEQAIVSFTQ